MGLDLVTDGRLVKEEEIEWITLRGLNMMPVTRLGSIERAGEE